MTNGKTHKYQFVDEMFPPILKIMEERKLTSISLVFTSGWNVKVIHPKAQKQLLDCKEITYPRKKHYNNELGTTNHSSCSSGDKK